MNITLWLLQILLSSYNAIGGIYTISNREQLKGTFANDLPNSVWVSLSVLQVLFALGLVIPSAFGMDPKITSISAAYLAANSLLGCALFSKYDGFPGVLWAILPAILCVFVAFWRWNWESGRSS